MDNDRENLMKGKLAQDTDAYIEKARELYGDDWTMIDLYQFKRSGGDIEKEEFDSNYELRL